MSVQSVATLQACLDNMKQFQQRYDAEQAKANRNQIKEQAYNNAYSAWKIRKAERDAALQSGRYAQLGGVWNPNNGTYIVCHQSPKTSGGPFDLCGYSNIETRLCTARGNADPGNWWWYRQPSPGGTNLDHQGCNCGSCAEQCCFDTSPNGPLRYNPNGSWYQNTWNSLEASDREPTKPALEPLLPITFNIQCSSCNQYITQGSVTATSVTQGDITQTMNCFNNQLSAAQQQAAADAAAAKTAAEAKAAADKQAQLDAIAKQAAAQEAAQKASEEAAQKAAAAKAAADTAEQSMQMMYIIMIVVFILVVVVGLAAYYFMGSESVPVKQYVR